MTAFKVRHVYLNPHDVERRIVFNKYYGGDECSVPGTCIIRITERKMKPLFFEALCLDVERNDFRNPIVVYRVGGESLLSFGGSRLRIAKRLDRHIPAIVIDYGGDFGHAPEVTPDNYGEFFTDVPELFEFTDIGVVTHYSLERNRRETYDPAGMEWTKCLDNDNFVDEEFPWLKPTQ